MTVKRSKKIREESPLVQEELQHEQPETPVEGDVPVEGVESPDSDQQPVDEVAETPVQEDPPAAESPPPGQQALPGFDFPRRRPELTDEEGASIGLKILRFEERKLALKERHSREKKALEAEHEEFLDQHGEQFRAWLEYVETRAEDEADERARVSLEQIQAGEEQGQQDPHVDPEESHLPDDGHELLEDGIQEDSGPWCPASFTP